jgi:aspartate/methionine/tyrosine aminotransferase
VQEGVTCNEAEGAMYLFPRVRLPNKAVQEALKHNKNPDSFYCLALLDQTGTAEYPTASETPSRPPLTNQVRPIAQASAWFQAPVSVKRTALTTSAPPSCRPKTRSLPLCLCVRLCGVARACTHWTR